MMRKTVSACKLSVKHSFTMKISTALNIGFDLFVKNRYKSAFVRVTLMPMLAGESVRVVLERLEQNAVLAKDVYYLPVSADGYYNIDLLYKCVKWFTDVLGSKTKIKFYSDLKLLTKQDGIIHSYVCDDLLWIERVGKYRWELRWVNHAAYNNDVSPMLKTAVDKMRKNVR